MTDGPTITVARAAELLHCERTKVFMLIADGTLERAPRFGRKTTVVTASVTRAALQGPRAPEARPRRSRRRARLAQLAAELDAVPLNGIGSSG